MKYYEFAGKSAKDILEEMTDLRGGDVGSPVLEMQKSALAVRITEHLCNSIDRFRQPSERASIALDFLTAAIGAAAVLQLYSIHCP